MRHLLLGLTLLLCLKPAFAEYSAPNATPQDYEEVISMPSVLTVPSVKSPFDIKVGALLGISDSSGSTSLAVGAEGELVFMKYLGVEAFAFHDISSGNKPEWMNAQPDANQYAAFSHLKGRFPFQIGKHLIVPKAGVGYGLRGGENLKFSGMTALAGVDLEFSRLLVVGAEFIKGVSGQVSGGPQLQTAASRDSDTYNRDFARMSLGIGVRLFEENIVGAKYIRSTLGNENKTLTVLQWMREF